VDARGYQFLLDFQGAPAGFSRYSLDEALSDKIPSAALEDRIVIVGYAAKSVKDHFYYPFSRGLEGEQHIFGITLHGHITSQLLRTALQGETPIGVSGDVAEGAWIWFWSMLGVLVGVRVRSLKLFSVSAVTGLALLGGLSYAVWLLRWWIPVVPPALGWLGGVALMTSYMANREKIQRAQLMQLFSRYIPQDVAQSLWEQRHAFLEGGRPRPQKLTATVFFSDLRGFTAVSEKMNPQTLMEWLNDYMETMAALVMSHGGVVDKFIGDAIMAVFGIPFARASEAGIRRDARSAVDCALAMREALNGLNLRWQDQGLPTIGMRIGIFTGPLVAGSLGSSDRMEYTVIGDTVNVASRLESLKGVDSHDLLTDELCRILTGESTLQYLEPDYYISYVGEMRLKGKKQAVAVHQVTGRK
jgi:adenylate cyclase